MPPLGQILEKLGNFKFQNLVTLNAAPIFVHLTSRLLPPEAVY